MIREGAPTRKECSSVFEAIANVERKSSAVNWCGAKAALAAGKMTANATPTGDRTTPDHV